VEEAHPHYGSRFYLRSELAVCHNQPARERLIRLRHAGDALAVRLNANGKDLGWFVVDLSSPKNLVDEATWRRSGFSVLQETRSNPSDQKSSPIVELTNTRVGGIPVPPHLAVEQDLQALQRKLGFHVSGVLGIPFFLSQPFTLDYAAGTLTLHDPDGFDISAVHGTSIPLRMVAGIPAVWAQLEGIDGVWFGFAGMEPMPVRVANLLPSVHPEVFLDSPGSLAAFDAGEVGSAHLPSVLALGEARHNVKSGFFSGTTQYSDAACAGYFGGLGYAT
jgi:hypothetical protein